MTSKFIFITGGVSSSLGKGLASASMAALLQARGFSVTLRKLDPYLNIDPGTMSPYQHGEVFVTDDGAETDLDLGHYERFSGINSRSYDYVTSGKIYSNVLAKERAGDYLGATVQVIPHITDEIKHFIRRDTDNVDFVLCEIGGTVGDIEGLPFIEAIRQMRNDLGVERTMFIHLTLLPFIATAGELKTKPAQHSVKELLSAGIQADLLLCRSDRIIPVEAKAKLAQFCNLHKDKVIAALDANNIYHLPLQYHAEGFDTEVCKFFDINSSMVDLSRWHKVCELIDVTKDTVKIAVVGKYVQLLDAYKSLIEALTHSGMANKIKVELVWVDATLDSNLEAVLSSVDGVVIPGGFGTNGIENKIGAISFARQNKIPTLGICFGMQLIVIEACRNLLGIKDASSEEFGPTPNPVVGLMNEWTDSQGTQKRFMQEGMGSTMRLGSYPCKLKDKSKIAGIYGTTTIHERHRHRYEVNTKYCKALEEVNLIFSGFSPDGILPEIVEYEDHPWFIAVQFHPELKSKPFEPHPLFVGLIKASLEHKNKK